MTEQNSTTEVPAEETPAITKPAEETTPVETNDTTPAESSQQETSVPEEEIEPVRDPILDTDEMRKVFVGGIPTDSSDEDIKEFFETTGGSKVSDITSVRKEKSVFSFITFETSEDVDELLLKREQLKFKERKLDVNRAVPKNNASAGARDKTKKLFIANLPKSGCGEEDLKRYFDARHPKKYGIIETIQLIKKKDEQGNKTEENKGYGFVMVSNEDMADKMAIQHATFEFGGRKIELKKSVPNAEGGNRGRGNRRGHGGYQQGYNGYSGGSYPYDDWNYGYGGYGGGYGGYGGGYGGYGGYGGPPGRGARGGGRYKPY